MESDTDREAANRLLDKVRQFVGTLDTDERALFAALVAPGVAQAYDVDDVVGFGDAAGVEWAPTALPDTLARALRERDIRVEGLS